jgi:hypothetical protein
LCIDYSDNYGFCLFILIYQSYQFRRDKTDKKHHAQAATFSEREIVLIKQKFAIAPNSCAGVALRFTPAYIVSFRWDGFYVNIFFRIANKFLHLNYTPHT